MLTTTLDATVPEPGQMLGAEDSSVTPPEQPIFVSQTRRRARAVNAAGGVLAVFLVVWVVALVGGGTGFVHLPAWRAAVLAPPHLSHRLAHVRRRRARPTRLVQATVALHAMRHRRGLRS